MYKYRMMLGMPDAVRRAVDLRSHSAVPHLTQRRAYTRGNRSRGCKDQEGTDDETSDHRADGRADSTTEVFLRQSARDAIGAQMRGILGLERLSWGPSP